ncbi:unnamed protein product [Protopolystoma xenopodis]|uniref:Uncharacterized protein n=1 Tax=Protopolystoma xenopodis TaxID=117903 RepID=A0A3S5A018_9PLAT|nr:unnamed protein product [Protopolystoma xenopodis]
MPNQVSTAEPSISPRSLPTVSLSDAHFPFAPPPRSLIRDEVWSSVDRFRNDLDTMAGSGEAITVNRQLV